MGGFANALGEVARGYTQAAELDKRRQFEAEIERRKQVGDWLSKLAQDPTARPETRQAAVQEVFDLHNLPWNKTYKLDANKLIAPPLPASTQSQPGGQLPAMQVQAPPPPPGTTPPMGAGVPGEAPVGATIPGKMMPSVTGMVVPPQPPGMFFTPEEQARQAAARAGAVTQATAGAQAHGQVYVKNPNGTFTLKTISGTGQEMGPGVQGATAPGFYGLSGPAVQMTAAQARTAGYPVPGNIGDAELVKVETLKSGEVRVLPATATSQLPLTSSSTTTDQATGLSTTTTRKTQRGVAPGGVATPPAPPSGGTKPLSKPTNAATTPQEQGATTQSTVLAGLPPNTQKLVTAAAKAAEERGIRLTGKLAPIVQAYADEQGITLHTPADMRDYNKAFGQGGLTQLADKRLAIMQEALSKPNAQNDVAMLFNHIGMTLSAQTGARITNAEIERAIKSRSLPENVLAALQKTGLAPDALYKMMGADPKELPPGGFLSPEQRKQMVDLGVTNRKVIWEGAVTTAQNAGWKKFPKSLKGLPALDIEGLNGQTGGPATPSSGPRTAEEYLKLRGR